MGRGGSAACVMFAILLASCASTTRESLSAKDAGIPDASTREELREASAVEEQKPQTPAVPSAKPAAATGDPDLAVALVSGEPIDVRSFLARIWLRSDVSREILDRLVVERMALLEAEREGIAVSQNKVDERLEVAWKALGDNLERQGRGVSIAKHLQSVLGVDTEYYRRQLRRDAIAQLVAERVVRAWGRGRERCVVRFIELADQKGLDAFSAGLAAGRDFDSLAKEFHRSRDKEPGGVLITLVRNENADLRIVRKAKDRGDLVRRIHDVTVDRHDFDTQQEQFRERLETARPKPFKRNRFSCDVRIKGCRRFPEPHRKEPIERLLGRFGGIDTTPDRLSQSEGVEEERIVIATQ